MALLYWSLPIWLTIPPFALMLEASRENRGTLWVKSCIGDWNVQAWNSASYLGWRGKWIAMTNSHQMDGKALKLMLEPLLCWASTVTINSTIAIASSHVTRQQNRRIPHDHAMPSHRLGRLRQYSVVYGIIWRLWRILIFPQGWTYPAVIFPYRNDHNFAKDSL